MIQLNKKKLKINNSSQIVALQSNSWIIVKCQIAVVLYSAVVVE